MADLKEKVKLHVDSLKKNPAASEALDQLADQLTHMAAAEKLLEEEEILTQEVPAPSAPKPRRSVKKARGVK
jgi:hypothetical protein